MFEGMFSQITLLVGDVFFFFVLVFFVFKVFCGLMIKDLHSSNTRYG